MLVSSMAFSSPTHNLTLCRCLHLHRPLLSPSLLSPPTFLHSSLSFPEPLPNPPFSSKIHCVEKQAAPSASGFDPKAGVAVYKPKSYEVLVTDAANSLAYALENGKIRLEIDFPYVYPIFFCFSSSL